MGEHVAVSLSLLGSQGQAEGAGQIEIARTQALALSQLIKKLSKNKELKGKAWVVSDQPTLRGVI